MIAYIAGPYRSDDKGVIKNINTAREIAILLWSNGIPAICPHLNTANFEEHVKDNDIFESGYLKILERCSVLVLTTDDYADSEGTMKELRLAFELKIPIVPRSLFDIWLSTVKKLIPPAGLE